MIFAYCSKRNFLRTNKIMNFYERSYHLFYVMFTLRLNVGVKFRGIDTLMSLAPALQYFGRMYPFVNRKKFRNVTQDDLYHN